ncbi:MAG: hypothetical protein OEW00_13460 [candidate division Zixibacteria bacterium]|nr:hypothetical protein [candidate division Zixibacteria bacterium]
MKHKTFSVLLILVGLLGCASGDCQVSRDDSGWPVPVYDEGCRSLMKALHQEWSRADGEFAFDIARRMIWALLLDPNAFYTEFSPDTVYYERFAKDLASLVFWNPNDTTTADLENLRIVAIHRLVEQTYSIEDRHLRLHEEMIENLRKVKVTHIDSEPATD